MSETRRLNPTTAPHAAASLRRSLFTLGASLWLSATLLSGSAIHEAAATEPAKATTASTAPQTSPVKVLWAKRYVPKETKDWPEEYPFVPERFHLPMLITENVIIARDAFVVSVGINNRSGGFDKLMAISLTGDLQWETKIATHRAEIFSRKATTVLKTNDGFLISFYETEPGRNAKSKMELVSIDYSGKKLWEKTYSTVGKDMLYPEYARIIGDNIEIVGKSRGWSLADFIAAERLVLSSTGQVLQPLAPLLKLPAPTTPQDNGQEQIYWCRRTVPAGDGWQEFCSMRPDKEITFHFDSKGLLEWQFPVQSTRATSYKFRELFTTDNGYELLGTLNESSSPLNKDKPTSLVLWRLDHQGKLLDQKTFPMGQTGTICCIVRTGTSGYLLVFEPLQSALAQGDTWENNYYAKKKDNIYLLAIQRDGTMTERLALPKIKHGKPAALLAAGDGYYLVAGNGAPNRVALHITKLQYAENQK